VSALTGRVGDVDAGKLVRADAKKSEDRVLSRDKALAQLQPNEGELMSSYLDRARAVCSAVPGIPQEELDEKRASASALMKQLSEALALSEALQCRCAVGVRIKDVPQSAYELSLAVTILEPRLELHDDIRTRAEALCRRLSQCPVHIEIQQHDPFSCQ
jgi:hypothetical protein